MAFNFPPVGIGSVGVTTTNGNVTYTWDGYKWNTTTGPFNVGATGATGSGVGIYAWARTSAAGNLEYSNGFASVVRPNPGFYRYTFSQPFVFTPDYTVTATPIFVGGQTTNPQDLNILISEQDTTGFTVRIYARDNQVRERDHYVQVVAADGPSGTGSAYLTWQAVGNIGTQQDFIDWAEAKDGNSIGNRKTSLARMLGVEAAKDAVPELFRNPYRPVYDKTTGKPRMTIDPETGKEVPLKVDVLEKLDLQQKEQHATERTLCI